MKKETKLWVFTGIAWGMIMYLLMTFIYPLTKAEHIHWKNVLMEFPLWMIAGLLYGYCMHIWKKKRNN